MVRVQLGLFLFLNSIPDIVRAVVWYLFKHASIVVRTGNLCRTNCILCLRHSANSLDTCVNNVSILV